MYEGCESKTCNVDQRSFKAYFTRELAATAELAPFTHDTIINRFATSAAAAVKTCTAGSTGTQCGLKWTTGSNDGSLGVGEQMAVLEIVQSNLIDKVSGWVSDIKGTGSSVGDADAGGGDDTVILTGSHATTLDRVGAGILTALILVSGILGILFLCI